MTLNRVFNEYSLSLVSLQFGVAKSTRERWHFELKEEISHQLLSRFLSLIQSLIWFVGFAFKFARKSHFDTCFPITI